MAITITQQPQPVVLSGNQSILTLMTDNHLEQGNYHIFDWEVPDDGFNVTAIFRFINLIKNIDVRVVCSTGSNSDVVVDARSYFPNFNSYLVHYVARLNASPLANHFFDFALNGDKIRCTSKVMSFYTVFVYRGGISLMTIQTIQSGADPIIKNGFRLGIKVMDAQYNLISVTPELREPNLGGVTTFDLSDYFSAVTLIDKPTNTEKIKQLVGGVNRYRIEVFEWLNNDIIGIPIVINITSLRGKSSFMQEALWNEEGKSFYNYVTASLNFLSTQPRRKNIAPNSLEWLYIYNHVSRVLTLKLKVYLSDGNTAISTAATLLCLNQKMVEFDVSPKKLNVFQYETSGITVIGYDVWLETPGITSHEIRQYRFDRNRYDQARTFIVRNDFGSVWETIRATGECEVKCKFERNVIETALPINYTTIDSNIEDIENKVIFQYELHWGFLSRLGDQREWKHYIMGVELSKKVFELISGYMIPCKFITQDVDFDADNRDYYTHVSSYRRAYFDTAYSPDDIPIVGDFNDDFNDDYFN